MTGTALGQIIALALSFIITRLYSPADFATLEQFAMILAILGVMATGKYEYAVMLPKSDDQAKALVTVAMRTAFWTSLVVLAFGFLFGWEIAGLFGNDDLYFVLPLIGLVLLLFSISNTLIYWFNRQKRYRVNSVSKIIFSGVSEPLKIVFSGFSNGGIYLVLSVLSGHLVTTWYLIRSENKLASWFREYSGLRQEMRKEYSDFPRYTMAGSVLNRLAQWAHIGLFSAFYGLWAVGFLALSRRVVMTPLNVIAASFSQVYFQRITEIDDARHLKRHYLMFLLRFGLIGVGMILLVWALPDETMSWLFGDEWGQVMEFLRILVFWFAFNFTVASLSFVNHRLRRQKLIFALDLTHFILVAGGVCAAYFMDFDELDALKMLCAAKVVYYIIHIFASLGALNRNIKEEPSHA